VLSQNFKPENEYECISSFATAFHHLLLHFIILFQTRKFQIDDFSAIGQYDGWYWKSLIAVCSFCMNPNIEKA
jgi:hypothetical protein